MDNQLGKIQRAGLVEAVDAYVLSGIEGTRKLDVGLYSNTVLSDHIPPNRICRLTSA
ncbi:hypothetical protein [Streptosporangium sp. NPDC000396]|uniref:hypothetical protein n=1 Tax=Streptosporangium sp. NPDC000396 TaxID=3366185 RepID=UPI0036B327E4